MILTKEKLKWPETYTCLNLHHKSHVTGLGSNPGSPRWEAGDQPSEPPYGPTYVYLLSAASHFLKEQCFWDGSQAAPVCPSCRKECKEGHCSVPCTSTTIVLVHSPFVHAFCPSSMNKQMKTSMDRGETSTRRKTCPSANLYIVNLTHSCLGSQPDLRRERPAANCVALARPLKAKTKQKEKSEDKRRRERKSITF
jgi:hypothetical protein